MTDSLWSVNETLPPDLAARVDAVCELFEKEWGVGKRPRIEDFLKETPDEELSSLLHELIALDIEYRRKVGEEPLSADYLERFPILDPSWLARLLLRRTTVKQPCPAAPNPSTAGSPAPVIPDYDLLHRIGHGSFGEVWLARNRHTGLFHAVKIIPTTKEIELEGIRAYKNQTQDHPNLVPIEHVGQSGEWIYYTMPLADDAKGSAEVRSPSDYEALTLHRHWQRQSPLPTDEVAVLADQLLAALEHLHLAGLIHKDVKPANILRMKGVWRLGDMGLTTSCEQVEPIRGTPAFWPPEGSRDRTADLYALGKTLYLLLAGAGPDDRFHDFVKGTFQPLAGDRKTQMLRKVILDACQENPEKRFATASSMRREIALFLHASGRQRSPLLTRRRLAIAGAAVAALGGILWVTRNWQTGPPAPLSMKELTLYVRRGGPQGKVFFHKLVNNEREADPEAIDPPIGPEDDFQLVGILNQSSYWYLLWIDTKGKAKVEGQSDQPRREVEYPASAFVSIDPGDPPGVHALVLVAGPVAPPKGSELLEQAFQGIGEPPKELPQRWTFHPRGSGPTRPGPADELPDIYLRTIVEKLPRDMELVHAIFLKSRK